MPIRRTKTDHFMDIFYLAAADLSPLTHNVINNNTFSSTHVPNLAQPTSQITISIDPLTYICYNSTVFTIGTHKEKCYYKQHQGDQHEETILISSVRHRHLPPQGPEDDPGRSCPQGRHEPFHAQQARNAGLHAFHRPASGARRVPWL